ncbi:MAG: hypothetical protein QOD77_12 [Thermoplasmata archaeon]|jgi:hypothetical protein|nr:hypothetical protein [Thermoplasmata archaeon]
MEEPEERTTEELVAAFRARKKAQVQAARGTAPEPEPAPAPTPEPVPAALAPIPPPPPARALGEIRPGTPPGSPLTVQSLRLSERLLADRRIAVRGLRQGRIAGAALLLTGLALLLVERYYASRGPGVVVLAGVPLLPTATALALLGAALMVLFTFVPTRPSLPVRLAASQGEEWDRVQGELKAVGLRVPIGWAVVVLGVLLAAAALTVWAGKPASRYGAGLGLLVAAAGLGLLLHALAKRAALHRLYVQTLVLSSLERTGLGPQQARDGRVAPVLQALDQLLGALPESTVRRFLATPEAERYLELMDELAQDGKDG